MLKVSSRRDRSMMIILIAVDRVEEVIVSWYSGHSIAALVGDGE